MRVKHFVKLIVALRTKENFLFSECFASMKVTIVDNYQGEENNIVVLSLVRSNNEKKV